VRVSSSRVGTENSHACLFAARGVRRWSRSGAWGDVWGPAPACASAMTSPRLICRVPANSGAQLPIPDQAISGAVGMDNDFGIYERAPRPVLRFILVGHFGLQSRGSTARAGTKLALPSVASPSAEFCWNHWEAKVSASNCLCDVATQAVCCYCLGI